MTTNTASIKKSGRDVSLIIKGPRITEKAAKATADGVYTFNVAPHANKQEIAQAIQKIYNVTPLKINTTRQSPRIKRVRGRKTKEKGYKKAMVVLQKGDSIEWS